MKVNQVEDRKSRATVVLALAIALPMAVSGQSTDPLNVMDKLRLHAEGVYSPTAIAGIALYAGILQEANIPREWGQGAGAYGERFGSTLAWSGIHSALAFGLDSTLHQDPRYFRSTETGGWRRAGHAFCGTMLTRTDSGRETISTWRIGSAFGAAFLSNQWYPDRLNTARLGLLEGAMTLGLDFCGNLGVEFWPDIKRKVLRRR